MPMDKRRYPADWPAISKRIRERDGNRCKWCGVANGAIVLRDEAGNVVRTWSHLWKRPDCEIWHAWDEDADGNQTSMDAIFEEGERRPVKIVLTVAHLGTAHPDGRPGDKHDKHDCRDENLAALCQRCHLRYDLEDHMRHAAETRKRKRAAAHQAAGQQELAL